jgi:hypothetical protein
MLLLYRGKSFVSWRIKMATLHYLSHGSWGKFDSTMRAAIRCCKCDLPPDLQTAIIRSGCIEAWHKGGVREPDSLRIGHKPGTVIDIYDLPQMEEFKFSLMDSAMREEVGKGYWFRGILAARTNRWIKVEPPTDAEGNISKWFCSHLLEEKLRGLDCGTVDLRRPSHGVWPGMMADSPLTKYVGSVTL